MSKDMHINRQLEAIKNIARASTKGSGLLYILDVVTKEIIETLDYGRVIIGLKDKRKPYIRFRTGGERGLENKEFKKVLKKIAPVSLVPDGKGRLGASAWSFLSNEEVYVEDSKKYSFLLEKTFQDKALIKTLKLGSYMIFPIHFGKDPLGIIIVDDKYIKRPLDDSDKMIMSTIADHTSVSIMNVEMLSEIKRANKKLIDTNRELKSSNMKYRQLVERGTDAIFIIQDYKFVFANRMFLRLIGYEKDEVLGEEFINFLAPESKKIMIEKYEDRFFGKEIPIEYEYYAIKKDGLKIAIWMRTSLTRFDGRLAVLCFAREITEKNRAEAELRRAKEYLENILESANDIIYVLDTNGIFTYVNPKFEELGYKREDLIGKSFLEILSEKHEGKRFRKTITTGAKQVYEVEMLEKGGEKIRNIVISTSPLMDENSDIEGVLVLGKDVTERKMAEEELIRLTITDSLTDLFNQRHFFKKIKEEVDRAKRMFYPLCLIIFDIDGFKNYNDTRGHLAGDEVLRNIGEITNSSIRKDVDSAFRYGGDEFAIILPYTSNDEATFVGERIKECIEDEIEDIKISMGICSLEGDLSVEDMINLADMAMYAKKDAEKSN
jgi:diguanylate cyclase (GGDEF)-like protein/PAS domain S-box-containing protein